MADEAKPAVVGGDDDGAKRQREEEEKKKKKSPLLHVLIIGAASAGLTIAQGLKKAGIPFSIFERDPDDESRYRDWGMTVHWSAAYLTRCLPQAILDRLPETQSDQQLDFDTITGFPVHNLETGEVLKEIPLTTPRRVSRKRWRKVMMEGLDIQFSKNLVDIEYPPDGSVIAHFEDGTSAKGTTLVGADGSKSATRHLLLGDKAALTTLPYVMVNTVVRYSPEHTKQITDAIHPFCHMGYHPEGTMFWISVMDNPDPADPSQKTFQVVSTWEGALSAEESASSPARLAALRTRISRYHPPFSHFAAWIPDDTPVHPDRIAVWDPLPVDHHAGRVCLAGDAAHNMTFHRGQGLNVALQDAADLVEAMVRVRDADDGGAGLAEAVRGFGELVLERGARECGVSMLTTRLVHRWGEFMRSPIMSGAGVSALGKGDEKK
ncbi:hypothetical protein FGG08_006542 [Glutinoglossum americanum]|uniref:FAD-binding domain-containing protein n=1 Tax=Glutinoglossum americanum TaxID=1670608 RepID=A0A9P8I382_9PEZI|nr:hypothetical protein FGG08_006542 [Glutinoglossum americanum]